MSIKISVIVPVYNTEKYLERCLDSILAQTYKNFELILVDDGSTDGSLDILQKYKKEDSRVVLIKKANGGSSSARNAAIKIAQGQYFSFIDSDDYIEPWFLERLVSPLEKDTEKKIKIVQIGRNEIDVDGNILKDICPPPKEELFVESKPFFESLIKHEGDCSFCTKLTSRDLFKDKGFPEGKLNEDFRLLIDFLGQCDGIYCLPWYGYHVFYREGSNSRKKNKNEFSRVFKDNIDNADYVEQLVKYQYPDLQDLATRFALYQRMDYMLHIPIDFMRRDYEGYSNCVGYIRNHWPTLLKNSYLTPKNKAYLTLFAFIPKTVRKIHAKMKRL